MTTDKRNGFTLIELSIVLVIIGLIVGGILIGQDMIKQATVRAQITQLQKYNTAVNTFRTKYGDLPGDMPPAHATQFGFYTSTGCGNLGDSARMNIGIIAITNSTNSQSIAWLDLSMAGLIDQSFTLAPWIAAGENPCSDALSALNLMLPTARLTGGFVAFENDGATNWFLVMGPSWFAFPGPYMTISVSDAYQIDTKIDDGKPTTGNVVARYSDGQNPWPTYDVLYSAATDSGTSGFGTPPCFNTTKYAYSMTYQGGASQACLLSVKLQ